MIPPLEVRKRRPVRFVYPNGHEELLDLGDEVGVDASYSYGEYRFLFQWLESRSSGGPVIRAAYYRKPPDSERWYFASQFTLTAERKHWVELLARAFKKDPAIKSEIEEAVSRIDA